MYIKEIHVLNYPACSEFSILSGKNKKAGKYQESIQSSVTPDPGHVTCKQFRYASYSL